jgi:predicted GH43/DUF377 family glycosyl hydrolase
MSTLFKRVQTSPLLKPNPLHEWEALNVFNCAVIRHNDLFHMLYRAQGVDYVSSIGYAVSADGISWNRMCQPVLTGEGENETRGVEDPRIVEIDGTFYMTFTTYSPNGILSKLAKSRNLITWERIGSFEWDNKDHVLFPRKIGGQFVMFHRRPPSIWITRSDDLKAWGDHEVLLEPRPDYWDSSKVGANGPPIWTGEGWLVIYHGVEQLDKYYFMYRHGLALLDHDDPTKVLHRSKKFVFEPEEPWEFKGDVPNVVFTCANPVVDGTIYLYYGGADRSIGLATATIADCLDFVKNE